MAVKLIATLDGIVVDNHGTEYSITIEDTGRKWGYNVVFNGTNGVRCGGWGPKSLSTVDDNMYLDFGQGWYVTGLLKIRSQFVQYIKK